MMRMRIVLEVVCLAVFGAAEDMFFDRVRFPIPSWYPEKTTLQRIKERGSLRCGVNPAYQLLYRRSKGGADGMEAKLCDAISTAIFGKPKSRFVSVNSKTRFEILLKGEVDVLFGDLTPTLGRETALHLNYSPVYFHGTIGFLARVHDVWRMTDTGYIEVKSVIDINKADIRYCVIKGTTNAMVGTETLVATPVYVNSLDQAMDFFGEKKCDLVLHETIVLSARVQSGLQVLGGVSIGRGPIAAATNNFDAEWSSVVAAVINGIIIAENLKLGNNALTPMSPAAKELVTTNRGLPLASDFMQNVLREVGSYEDLYRETLASSLPREQTRNFMAHVVNDFGAYGLLNALEWRKVTTQPAQPPMPEIYDTGLYKPRSTLLQIIDSKRLRCGTTPNSTVGAFLYEYCNAVAAVLKVRPQRVMTTPDRAEQELLDGRFDLLLSADAGPEADETTASLAGVMHSDPVLFDGIGMLVPKVSEVTSFDKLQQLAKTYCLTNETKGYLDRLPSHLINAKPVLSREGELAQRLSDGTCDAVVGLSTELHLVAAYVTVDTTPVKGLFHQHSYDVRVRSEDPLWVALVLWVVRSLVIAGFYEIKSSNIGELALDLLPNEAKMLLGKMDYTWPMTIGLPIAPNAFVLAIKQVGNYGEMFNRHLASFLSDSPMNQPWNVGMYATAGSLFAPIFLPETSLDTIFESAPDPHMWIMYTCFGALGFTMILLRLLRMRALAVEFASDCD